MKLRRLAVALASASIVTVSALAAAGSAVTAQDPVFYYKAAWGPSIYRVTGTQVATMTYAQWTASGNPNPLAAEVIYTKLPWDATIYRSTFFTPPGGDPDGLHIAQEPFEKNHQETPAEWAAAGYQNLQIPAGDNLTVYKWDTSDELFDKAPNGLVHKLTSADWASLESIYPTVRANEGYLKLSWSAPIAFSSNLDAGAGSTVTFGQWAAQALPTPRQAVRFPGDQFYRHRGSATIYYAGPTMNRAITYAEWTAAGSPKPTLK